MKIPLLPNRVGKRSGTMTMVTKLPKSPQNTTKLLIFNFQVSRMADVVRERIQTNRKVETSGNKILKHLKSRQFFKSPGHRRVQRNMSSTAVLGRPKNSPVYLVSVQIAKKSQICFNLILTFSKNFEFCWLSKMLRKVVLSSRRPHKILTSSR